MTANLLPTIRDVRLFELPEHVDDNGSLVVMQGEEHVPFRIARVFAVTAPVGGVRGEHAHRRCAQFLVCMSGAIEVLCNDGANTARFIMDRLDHGLLIPPNIWAKQTYRKDNSVLMVLCDRRYEAADYIRDYAEFQTLRRAGLVDRLAKTS